MEAKAKKIKVNKPSGAANVSAEARGQPMMVQEKPELFLESSGQLV